MGDLASTCLQLQQEEKPFAWLPKVVPQLIAYSDVSKRVSTCQICSLPIKKRSKRSVFAVKTNRRVFRGGGSTAITKVFMHPKCIISILEGEGKQSVAFPCWDCGASLTSWSAGRKALVPDGKCVGICIECSIRSPYIVCGRCSIFVHKQIASIVLSNSKYGAVPYEGQFVCNPCAIGAGLHTARMQAEEDRREAKFQAKFDRLYEKLKAGRGFE